MPGAEALSITYRRSRSISWTSVLPFRDENVTLSYLFFPCLSGPAGASAPHVLVAMDASRGILFPQL